MRFAGDFIAGSEEREDAERFLDELRGRSAKSGPELHPGKTRLTGSGRHAARHRKARGLGKPETSDFPGFTHICAASGGGRSRIRRITISERMRAKLEQVKDQLTHAPARSGARPLAGQRGARAHGVLRRARQHPGSSSLPRPGNPALAADAAAPQPGNPDQLGTDGPDRSPVATARPHDAPLPPSALHRHAPKAGAQCGSSARWDLRGAPPVRAVPTATIHMGGFPAALPLPATLRLSG